MFVCSPNCSSYEDVVSLSDHSIDDRISIMGQLISKNHNIQLDGFCDKNYEPVKKHVEKMLHEGLEENLQLCVYVDEKCVVDLYGTAIGDSTYNAETIQVIEKSLIIDR